MQRLKRLIQYFKSIFGFKVSGVYTKKRREDIFLVSYPKSGNTWMRFIMGAIGGKEIDFVNMEDIVPDIYANSKRKLDAMPSPRMIKSHEMWLKESNYHRVIYIYRSPYDVCVSYYHWYKKYAPEQFDSFNDFFESFIEDDLPHGGWGEHFQSWIDFGSKFSNRILFMSYEDLRKDTFGCVKKIISFLNIQINDQKITSAIDYASFGNMQKMEKNQTDKSELFKKSKDSSVSFVRKGKGNYKDNYSDEQLNRIEHKFAMLIHRYGY